MSFGRVHSASMAWFAAALAPLLVAANAMQEDRARSLHRDAFVFDAHVHVVNRHFYGGGDLGQRQQDGQVDLPRLREGGYDAFFFSLFVPEEYYPSRYETRQVLRLLAAAHEQLERNKDAVELALTAPDIARINAAGKLAAVLDLEGGFDLDGDLGILRELHRLGFRSLQLAAHNWANGFADSCCAPRRWGGLNDRGRAVVREMNRLGMVINVSHASDETIEQTLEISSDPIVATHHGLRHFNDIPRTMSDALLRKLAAKGGVIAFQIGNSFHNRRAFEWQRDHQGRAFWETGGLEQRVAGLSIEEVDALVARRPPDMREGPDPPDELLMSVDDWVDVVDYAIRLVGEDHVALGTDWDGGPTPPRGMRDARDIPMITEAMLRRGYSEERIRKFLGANLLRVFGQVTRPTTTP
jgi:membrane dipeptidase